LGLQRLIPWGGAQPGTGCGTTQRIGGRCSRIHRRVGNGVAESECDHSAFDRQTVGIGQLDHQGSRQRFADRRALIVAADDGKGGGRARSGRQGQTLAATGEGEHGEEHGRRTLPHSVRRYDAAALRAMASVTREGWRARRSGGKPAAGRSTG
jgi:hypothetical protein